MKERAGVPSIGRRRFAWRRSCPAGQPGTERARAAGRRGQETASRRRLYNGRTERKDGDLITVDTNCDGRGDAIYTKPDDKSRPITAEFDSNYDGKIDIIVEDLDRDGRWDISYYDVDFDGKIDLVGYHPDGKIQASR